MDNEFISREFQIVAEKIDILVEEFEKEKADKSETIEVIGILRSYLEKDEVKNHPFYYLLYMFVQTAIAKLSVKAMN